jgi:hypothetical protein
MGFVSLLAALALSLPPVAPAGVPGSGVVRLTGASPFPAACEARGPQRGAEVEPSIAASGALVVAAWQQDRYLRAAAAGLGVSVSRDGGVSWAAADVPGLTDCTPLRRIASDPWVSIGRDGAAYLSGIEAQPRGSGLRTRVAVSVLRPGATTWSAPALLDAGGDGFNDKPSITADPLHPGSAYVVWDLRASAFMSSTSDGGRTWAPPREIERHPPGTGTVASTISVLPNGALLHAFLAYGRGGLRIEAARSTDRGVHWSAARIAARVPRRRGVLRTGRPAVRVLPISGTGPAVTSAGTIYEAFVSGGTAVDVVSSSDGGRSWSPPVVAFRSARGVFGPALAAGAGGLALSFYAREPGGAASLRVARSGDARSWRTRTVAVPFSLRRAPSSQGAAFLGDYSGLAPLGTGFAAAFAATAPLASSGASDVLVAGFGG